MDGILDTVSAAHPLLPLLMLLKSHGKLVLVGVPTKALELPVYPLVQGKKLTILTPSKQIFQIHLALCRVVCL